jgi:acetoin utilization protein AcuB
MLVRDWMTERVEVVQPGDDVAAVQARFRERRVRQFPVVADGKLVGIITDRDVRGARDAATKVETVMTPKPVTTTPSALVEDAAEVLRRHKVGALPVLDGDAVVGIVSESDLLQALIELTHILEPTTFIELECAGGLPPVQRIRALLERKGGHVPWISAVPRPGACVRVALRVRMPLGHAPERILEEAGIPVLSCVTGRAVALVPPGAESYSI